MLVSAVVLGAAAGSGRVFWAVFVLGVVSPPLWAGWWLAAPVLADRDGWFADWCAYWHARHTWPALAEQLGLALVDPRSARRLIPAAGGGAVAGSGALVLDPGETRWIVPRLRFARTADGWTAEGRLPGGVLPEHFNERVPYLLHAWRAFLLTVDSPRRGWVRLVVFRSDPLRTPIPALPVPAADAVDLTALVLGRRHPRLPAALPRRPRTNPDQPARPADGPHLLAARGSSGVPAPAAAGLGSRPGLQRTRLIEVPALLDHARSTP